MTRSLGLSRVCARGHAVPSRWSPQAGSMSGSVSATATDGAGAEIRTRTPLRAAEFKSAASAIPPLRRTRRVAEPDARASDDSGALERETVEPSTADSGERRPNHLVGDTARLYDDSTVRRPDPGATGRLGIPATRRDRRSSRTPPRRRDRWRCGALARPVASRPRRIRTSRRRRRRSRATAVSEACCGTPVSLQIARPSLQPSTSRTAGPSPGREPVGLGAAKPGLPVGHGCPASIDGQQGDVSPAGLARHWRPDERERASLGTGNGDRLQSRVAGVDGRGIELVASERELGKDHHTGARGPNGRGMCQGVGRDIE